MTGFEHAIDFTLLCRAFGVTGFLLYMGSFAALQLEWIDGHGLAYSLLNITAASLVLVSLSIDFNLASAMIQVSWIAIGAIGVAIRLYQLRQRRRRYAAILAPRPASAPANAPLPPFRHRPDRLSRAAAAAPAPYALAAE